MLALLSTAQRHSGTEKYMSELQSVAGAGGGAGWRMAWGVKGAGRGRGRRTVPGGWCKSPEAGQGWAARVAAAV